MEKQKNYGILIILLLVVVFALGGYIVYDKLLSNDQNKTESNTNETKLDSNYNKYDELLDTTFGDDYTQKEVSVSDENIQLLEKTVGDWGRCNGFVCNGLMLSKDENGKFYYVFYQPSAGGFRRALIINVTYSENNKYEITGYYPAINNEVYSNISEKEEKLVIDISKISSNIISINDIEYEKITTKRDEFFDSKISQEREKFDKIVGDWGRCSGTSCNGIEIMKDENGAYSYVFYLPNAGEFRRATVIYSPQKISNNKYEITGYYPAINNEVYSNIPEKEEKLVIDISKISSNIIVINDIEYEKIMDNKEAFYNSKQS